MMRYVQVGCLYYHMVSESSSEIIKLYLFLLCNDLCMYIYISSLSEDRSLASKLFFVSALKLNVIVFKKQLPYIFFLQNDVLCSLFV